MKKIITTKEQKHLTKICKYCKGTGRDIFNKTDDCPNCVTPYEVELTDDEITEQIDEELSYSLRIN